MPWSPIPKFPEVISYIKRKGLLDNFNRDELEEAMMVVLGVSQDKTMSKIGKMMMRLNYIVLNPDGTFKYGDKVVG